MKTGQVVICGLGGQGILFMTRLLAEAILLEGGEVLVSETHGMAQRGGAVESHVKFGDFHSPLVRRGRAKVAIALDESRLEAAQLYLKEGGTCIVNAPQERPGVRAREAGKAATELGHPRGANLFLLGFATSACPELFPAPEAFLAALERLSPPSFLELNRRAFEKGRQSA